MDRLLFESTIVRLWDPAFSVQRSSSLSADPAKQRLQEQPHRRQSKPQMALNSAAQALKAGVLRHIRLPLQHAYGASTSGSAALSLSLWRGFAGGGYLDKDVVTQRVLDVTKHFEKIEPAKVKPSAHFEKDLGLDSLDVVELVMAFEEEFCIEIPDNDADKIFSVEDAVNYIAQHPMAK